MACRIQKRLCLARPQTEPPGAARKARRRVDSGSSLSGKGIADLILQCVTPAAKNLQQGAVVALLEDRQLWPALVVISRAFPIAVTQRLGDACIELWQCTFQP